MANNKQLFLNIGTNALSYLLGLFISFFLTPYIVSKLGIDAYGFIGLSMNIISYTSLLTVALNSMSGRYIGLYYHKKDYDKANIYLASVFFSNVIFALILLIGAGGLIIWLDYILDIPFNLVTDVKLLLLLLFINTAIGLVTNVFHIATFVKNKIEKSNISSMISTLLRSGLLILLFMLFAPKLWYFGLTAIVMTVYIYWANYHFYSILTPELRIKFCNFKIGYVIEIIKSGIWNLISSLGTLLNEGFDLLLANLFIGPIAMGVLSVSKTIPTLVSSFISSLENSFYPEYMKLYADGSIENLKLALLKSIRIFSFLSAIPLAIIFSYGDMFFCNWLPKENYNLLYAISCLGSFYLLFSIPLQSIWYLFFLYNKIKKSSINSLENSLITFLTVIIGMLIFDDNVYRLFIVAGVRTVTSSYRSLTFMPIYASKLMNLPKITFYRPIFRNVFVVFMITTFSILLKYHIGLYSWGTFFLASGITTFVGLILGWFFILKKEDKSFIGKFVLSKFR